MTTSIEFRVSEQKYEEYRKLAITLGHVKPDGTANLSSFVRACCEVVRREVRAGRIVPVVRLEEDVDDAAAVS